MEGERKVCLMYVLGERGVGGEKMRGWSEMSECEFGERRKIVVRGGVGTRCSHCTLLTYGQN